MKNKIIRLLTLSFLLILAGSNLVVGRDEPDQQITDFNLSGYGKEGTMSWQVNGRSADIFQNDVVIDAFTGKIFGEENINLSADKGEYNKETGKIHLQDNVVATTSSGATLTTDSLDWDQKSQQVTTQDRVNIERQNLRAQGLGAKAQADLNKVFLEKEVKVEIQPEDQKEKSISEKNEIIITCDGPLEVAYQDNRAVFSNNVKATTKEGQILCDKMTIFFSVSEKVESAKDDSAEEPGILSSKSGKIEKLVAEGNVKIVQGENVTFSETATYTASDKKIILTGRPKLFIYSEGEGNNAPFGN